MHKPQSNWKIHKCNDNCSGWERPYITGSFFCRLSEHGGLQRGLHLPGNPITAAVIRKAIKLTHCINLSFANEHNFKQNYAMLNQKVLPLNFFIHNWHHISLFFVMMPPSSVYQTRTFLLFTLASLHQGDN